MPHLKLKLVSGEVADQQTDCRFTEFGGSIGRAEECDWTLLDVDRFVSKKHILISFRNNQFVLTDVSSNGVVINNALDPLGRDNEYNLQASDKITVGKFVIEVEELNTQTESMLTTPAPAENAPSDDGLLGLVMGSSSAAPAPSVDDFFKSPNVDNSETSDSGLGLNELLSGTSAPSQAYKSSQNQAPTPKPESPFTPDSSSSNPFITDALNPPSDANPIVSDGLIPDDWELSDFEPPTEDYKAFGQPQASVTSPERSEPEPTPPVERPVSPQPAAIPEPVVEKPVVQPPSEIKPSPASIPTNIEPPISPVTKPVNNADNAGGSDDPFFKALYEKLGLPKEYLASIDTDAFADDIVTILLSTTRGLMALLSSRTAFKQESRLSSTLIQPKSNNPIKFSIDPVDTLEMLLLKKKKGYMSTQASYDEAMEDIQLHQMAFMSGLQATLEGVLKEIAPESIEKQVSEKGKTLMRINANSQCWQLYKERQQTLSKTVSENLNEVLGSYFSDAYQAQINSFKNGK